MAVNVILKLIWVTNFNFAWKIIIFITYYLLPVLNIIIITLDSDSGHSKSVLYAHVLNIVRIHSRQCVDHGKATQKSQGHHCDSFHGVSSYKGFNSNVLISEALIELLMIFQWLQGVFILGLMFDLLHFRKMQFTFDFTFLGNYVYFHFSWKLCFWEGRKYYLI